MVRGLSAEDNELYQRTDEVMHYIWDPIGVQSEPNARGEYHAYLPQVFQLLKSNSSANIIADYLDGVEVEQMGFERCEPSDRLLRVAEMLVVWKKYIDRKYAADRASGGEFCS